MIKILDSNEIVLYRLKKGKFPILFMIIFFPIWMYFSSIFLRPAYQFVFSDSFDFLPSEGYIAGMIGLILFIELVIIIFLSYSLNGLIITDQRVYIRKGVAGRIHILNLCDIRSFQHVYSTGRNQTNHSILFYMLCGKKIKTAELYITINSMQALLETLRGKLEGSGFTNRELNQMKNDHPEAGQPILKFNPIALTLTFAPIILALALTIFYLSGAYQ